MIKTTIDLTPGLVDDVRILTGDKLKIFYNGAAETLTIDFSSDNILYDSPVYIERAPATRDIKKRYIRFNSPAQVGKILELQKYENTDGVFFFGGLDKNEIFDIFFPSFAADPPGVEKNIIYNTTDHKLKFYDGLGWREWW